MKKIPLKDGLEILVDDEDFEIVNKWKWFPLRTNLGKTHYAQVIKKIDGVRKSVYMHRLIMNCPIGMEIDHINGNGLDNRKCNLRIVTGSQNKMNRSKQANNKSGHKGVFFISNLSKWKAYIKKNGKTINLGLYKEKEDAILARKEAEKKFFGEYAYEEKTQ